MKRAIFWFLGILLIEGLSFAVIFHPLANSIIAFLIGIIIFFLTIRRPSMALVILSTEYLIGSHGALFKFLGDAENHGGVSIRIILFFGFLFGWVIWSLRNQTWKHWSGLMRERKIYFFLGAVMIYGVLLGLLRHNVQWFADANAWGTWLLLLPVLDVVNFEREKILPIIKPAFVAALSWLSVKTLVLLYLFTHGLAELNDALYLWVRRSGVGEITPLGEGAHRIFLQSQIFAIFSSITILSYLIVHPVASKKINLLFWLNLSVILVSLSRSFWLGLAAGGLVLLFHLIRHRWKSARKIFTLGFFSFIAGVFLMAFVTLFPWPRVRDSAFFEMWGGRVSVEEKAAMSRWQLFPVLWNKIKEQPIFGSGFGATVTYQSFDPRIVAKTGGMVTTYAFEWGWLEHWIKFGVLGIPMMLWILIDLGRRTQKSILPDWTKLAIISSLVTLATIHIFSPYLNHPLGIFAIIGAEAFLLILSEKNTFA